MKKRIGELEPGVDVFLFRNVKWRKIMESQFHSGWWRCRPLDGGDDGSFHENDEYEVIGHIGDDGKLVEVIE